MPKILDDLAEIADEKNFFIYQMPMKVPCKVGSLGRARNTDKAAVSTLGEVLAAIRHAEDKGLLERINQERAEYHRKMGADGEPRRIEWLTVGYVPREGSRGVVVDLDKCVDDQGRVRLSDEGLQEAFDAYVESGGWWQLSPSGTGVRVVMPRAEWVDELNSDRREAGGVGFQAAQEKGKGFTLMIDGGQGVFRRGDRLVEEAVRVRNAALAERRSGDRKEGVHLDGVALEWAHVSIDDLESMLSMIPNEGDQKNERGWFVGMTKAIREAFEPRGLGEAAWDLWDAWTAQREPYDPEWNRRVWDEPLGGDGAGQMSLASLLKESRERGGFRGSWETFDFGDEEKSEEKDPGGIEEEGPYDFLGKLDSEMVGPSGKKVRRAIYNYMNCVRVVRYMPALKGLVGRNVLSGGLMRLRKWSGEELDIPVEWTDLDMHRLLQTVQGFKKGGTPVFGHFGIEGLKNGIEGAAVPIQPIARMLDRVGEWDGVPRIDGWLERYFGVDEPMGRIYARKFMIGLVARGRATRGRLVKMDTVLVLRGEQGRNKSSFFEKLSRGFFTDHVGEIRKKESLENIAGRWVVELSEGDVVSKADRRFLNGYLTRVEDRFRPSYARNVETFPRACVFVMPTNDEEVLLDPTGSRRFWPVTVKKKADLDRLGKERGQMLAEALVALERGEQWWLTDEEDEMRRMGAVEYEAVGAIEEPMERVLREVVEGQIVTQGELLEALGLPEVGVGVGVLNDIRGVLRKWGWERVRTNAKRGYRRKLFGDTRPEMSEGALKRSKKGEVVDLSCFSVEK